ncbi:MAG: excisionase, partial [Clostridiales Family XIII bacterium]|nr:excisionase [Clostridiales Family XIII bacterium]
MEYTLMHKTVPVLALEIDTETSAIFSIGEVFCAERVPVGVEMQDGRPVRKSLNDWWQGRAIPASRSGLREALEALRISSTGLLLLKCFGLSLSDHYWVDAKDKPLDWDSVNFFNNEFSEDVGNALFGRAPADGGAELDLLSPDNTSDGWLKKKWVVADGKRLLLKGGSVPYFQEPLNEVLASDIMARLGIPHATYTLAWDDGHPLSVCEDFVDTTTEYVSAWHVYSTRKRSNNDSVLTHYLKCCDALGIPGVREGIDRMLAVDYLMANADRHFNNFGVMRNVDTLAWLGPAPIFDTGTSMWYDTIAQQILAGAPVDSKPFRPKHDEQIKLVSDFSWLDFDALAGVDEAYAEVLAQSPFIDAPRRKALCRALARRIAMLQEIA